MTPGKMLPTTIQVSKYDLTRLEGGRRPVREGGRLLVAGEQVEHELLAGQLLLLALAAQRHRPPRGVALDACSARVNVQH